jgi:hypothetical protein
MPRTKHSSLLQTFVIAALKSFITLGPGLLPFLRSCASNSGTTHTLNQGTLTEREGSVRMTSSLRYQVCFCKEYIMLALSKAADLN